MKSYPILISRGYDYVLNTRYVWALRLNKLIEAWQALPTSNPKKYRLFKLKEELYLRLKTLVELVEKNQSAL